MTFSLQLPRPYDYSVRVQAHINKEAGLSRGGKKIALIYFWCRCHRNDKRKVTKGKHRLKAYKFAEVFVSEFAIVASSSDDAYRICLHS